MNRNNKFNLGVIALFLLTVSLFVGCKGGGKTASDEAKITIAQDNEAIMRDIKQAEKIFNALPSPLESAMLIKSAGAQFNESLLNPVENVSSYVTNKAMALNLGAYTSDLCVASMYEQTQLLIDYMNAAKKMADGLGILDAIAQEDIDKLEENINDTEVIMSIVSATFMNSNSYLEDNGQPATAAMVLVGGWIEGLYVSTQLVDMSQFDGNKLVSRIIDQKLSIDILLNLLDESKDNQNVSELISQIQDLKVVFDKINIQASPARPVYDEATNSTVLKSQVKTDMTPEVFTELSQKVTTIRNTFVK